MGMEEDGMGTEESVTHQRKQPMQGHRGLQNTASGKNGSGWLVSGGKWWKIQQ